MIYLPGKRTKTLSPSTSQYAVLPSAPPSPLAPTQAPSSLMQGSCNHSEHLEKN